VPNFSFRGERAGEVVVKSLNFEFLRSNRPYLADLGGFAEQYLHADPASALIKLRLFAESMVNDFYSALGLRQPFQSDFLTILDGQPFKDSVPPVVLTKLHAIRKLGNKAAHGAAVDFEMARRALHEAYHLGSWFHLLIDGGAQAECGSFAAPPEGGLASATKADLKREKKAALEKLAAQEAQMERLLAELEQTRAKAEAATKTAHELQSIVDTGFQIASQLAFSEAETRKYLVDSMLVSAGWEVGPNLSNTADVGQEVDVEHQPTPTGKGKADYVLWDAAGKPVAVVEVKKTSIEAALGQAHA
jgi:type I restriction enzyme R subunit